MIEMWMKISIKKFPLLELQGIAFKPLKLVFFLVFYFHKMLQLLVFNLKWFNFYLNFMEWRVKTLMSI